MEICACKRAVKYLSTVSNEENWSTYLTNKHHFWTDFQHTLHSLVSIVKPMQEAHFFFGLAYQGQGNGLQINYRI